MQVFFLIQSGAFSFQQVHLLFCTVASLQVLFMIVFDVKAKVLDTETFLQHTITNLNSGITFTVLFSQEKPLM